MHKLILPKIYKSMAAIEYDSLKAFNYSGGDLPKPPTNKNYLRLYGHNLCPFVERSALALKAKDIQFQYTTMNLDGTPQWHIDINGGAIPLLENTDGKIYFESALIAEFSDEINKAKGFELFPSDPFKKLEMKIEIENFNKFVRFFYGLFYSKGQDDQAIQNLKEALPEMEKYILNGLKGKDFLLGSDTLTYADIHAFVIFERISLLKGSTWNEIYEKLEVEKLIPESLKWVSRIRSIEALKDVIAIEKAFHKLLIKVRDYPEGMKPKLDLEMLE